MKLKIIAANLNAEQITIIKFENSSLFQEFKKHYPSFSGKINDILEKKQYYHTYNLKIDPRLIKMNIHYGQCIYFSHFLKLQ